ncbi:MAG: DEAD/DEAH box helicase [Burkholderiaceae bacterium]|nr:DEAD/DEAH box helicase [Burkholderiaceae bacterium]
MNGLPARLPMPGPAYGVYPERVGAGNGEQKLSAAWHAIAERVSTPRPSHSRRRFVAAMHSADAALAVYGSGAFAQQLRELRAQMGSRGFVEPLLATAFAMVARTTASVLGLTLYDTQLIAARILLDNRLAEMATGEGKTHAAMLAAATAALAGVPVHVVTANAYLAARDADQLAPVYAALGLRVAAIRQGDDDDARRGAYRCDIVYCTASNLIFDYLRDRTAGHRAQPLLRGLCMAIVDEADSVLIDEARTPFILARERHDAAAEQRHRSALALATGLRAGDHFRLDASTRRAHLEPLGAQICAGAAAGFGTSDALWNNQRYRDELIDLALTALHHYQRDVHYIVRELDGQGKFEVAIVDTTTGRVAAGRRWANGLHQLIELKERCQPSPLQDTSAQLTYQRFFPRYWRLGGMSGTLREARTELRQVYGLAVEAVPLRVPCRRIHSARQIFANTDTRWDAVVTAITREQAAGRPVLVGTDSVADAQLLSDRLHKIGIAHQRLDARQDAEEAACIARAGTAGCVTVATNMAGRGTDIRLGPGVLERGGLRVIACQQNASARIDRQLHGRAARAGDPGAVSTMLALDVGLLAQRVPRLGRRLLHHLARPGTPLPAWLATVVLGWLQTREEQRTRRARSQLLEADRKMLRSLGFGAQGE